MWLKNSATRIYYPLSWKLKYVEEGIYEQTKRIYQNDRLKIVNFKRAKIQGLG